MNDFFFLYSVYLPSTDLKKKLRRHQFVRVPEGGSNGTPGMPPAVKTQRRREALEIVQERTGFSRQLA